MYVRKARLKRLPRPKHVKRKRTKRGTNLTDKPIFFIPRFPSEMPEGRNGQVKRKADMIPGENLLAIRRVYETRFGLPCYLPDEALYMLCKDVYMEQVDAQTRRYLLLERIDSIIRPAEKALGNRAREVEAAVRGPFSGEDELDLRENSAAPEATKEYDGGGIFD